MSNKIILASASPRRIEIFHKHGIQPEVRPADVDEWVPEGTLPHLACMYNALKKAMAILEAEMEPAVIVAADTIVYDGKILGKPAGEKEAFQMLAELRGRTHAVYSGVAVADTRTQRKQVFYEKTDVTFMEYSDQAILEYIATGEPLDKAGAYAIQGQWRKHVVSVNGDVSNVIGLPWTRLAEELHRFEAQNGGESAPWRQNDTEKG